MGVLIDGINYSGIANAASLLDIEQVEILRGPQGTRFGVAALAGVVQLVSHKPSNELEGNLGIELGNYQRRRLQGTINIPLSEDVYSRFSVQKLDADGYIRNTFLDKKDTNNLDELIAKGTLTWQVSEQKTVDATIHYIDVDNGYDAFSLDQNRTTLSNNPGKDRQRGIAYSLSLTNILPDDTQLWLNVNGENTDLLYSFDEDWCNPITCPPADGGYDRFDRYERNRHSLSFEGRLTSSEDNSWRWVTGLYHRHREVDLVRQRTFTPAFDSNYNTANSSICGQVTWDISPQWQLKSGLRIEYFSDDYDDNSNFNSEHTSTLWGGDVSLSYFVDTQMAVYGLISRGFKAGGINTEANANANLITSYPNFLRNGRLSYEDESLTNFEIGLKYHSVDDRLNLTATLFYMDRHQAQVESSVFDPVSFVFVGYIDNAQKAYNRGLELQMDYQFNAIVSGYANLGLLDTDITGLTVIDVDSAAELTLNHRHQANAPRTQFSTGIKLQITDSLAVNISADYKQSYFYAPYHQQQSDAYTLLNASVDYHIDDNWQLQLWGRNLTRQNYAVRGFYFGNDPRPPTSYANRLYEQLGEPQVLGFNVRYSF